MILRRFAQSLKDQNWTAIWIEFAAVLRADATLVPLLRLRLANVYSATSTQVMSDEVLENLRALSRGKP